MPIVPPLEQKSFVIQHRGIQLELPTQTGAPRDILASNRDSIFLNPFYQWNQQRYKMSKKDYWFILYDVLAGHFAFEQTRSQGMVTVTEAEVSHLGLLDYIFIFPFIFKTLYYLAPNKASQGLIGLFAVPLSLATHVIASGLLAVTSPLLYYGYDAYQKYLASSRQNLTDIVWSMEIIPLPGEGKITLTDPREEEYPRINDKYHRITYQLFNRYEKPSVDWYEDKRKTLRKVMAEKRKKVISQGDSLPRWILLPIKKRTWLSMGFSPLSDYEENPVWGLYPYVYDYAYQCERECDCPGCSGSADIFPEHGPLVRFHTFSPIALWVPHEGQPREILDAMQQLNAFCFQEVEQKNVGKMIKRMAGSLQSSIDLIMLPASKAQSQGDHSMSSTRSMNQAMEQQPAALPAEAFGASAEAQILPEASGFDPGIKENLFDYIQRTRPLFMGIPWPWPNQILHRTCHLTGLLLLDPISCGNQEKPHSFEYSQLEEKKREKEKTQPGKPFHCPDCDSQKFSRNDELRNEIHLSLRQVIRHLEELGSQDQVPLRPHVQERWPTLTSSIREEIRVELIGMIQQFLLYGNDKNFLKESFSKRAAARLKSAIWQVRTNQNLENSVAISQESLEDVSQESKDYCLLL